MRAVITPERSGRPWVQGDRKNFRTQVKVSLERSVFRACFAAFGIALHCTKLASFYVLFMMPNRSRRSWTWDMVRGIPGNDHGRNVPQRLEWVPVEIQCENSLRVLRVTYAATGTGVPCSSRRP